MATSPIFAATPRCSVAQIATADASRTGPAAAGTVWTAGGSGSRIERVTIQAATTTTTGMVRLFIHDGTNYRLWKEIPITAITVSATVGGFNYELDCSLGANCLVLQSGYSLRASTEKAETFNVLAFGGDF